MELIETLTKELGVREEQAKKGVGLLFQLVKENFAEEDFVKVALLVPGLQEVLEAGNLSGVGASQDVTLAGESGLGLKRLESLVGGFLRLGLDYGMVNKFIPFVVSHIRQKGGDEINNLSEKDLRWDLRGASLIANGFSCLSDACRRWCGTGAA